MTTIATPPKPPELTPEQARALELRDCSVALSAGAGCGKTFVLTQRFLAQFDPRDRQAVQPEDIGSVVAITFTNAAAREMRDRVRQACYERMRASSGAEAGYWSALVRSLDAARISTIDAFCSALLRAHAVEAALDPRFAVFEPAQTESLLAELTDDTLRERLSAHDPTTLDLAVLFDLGALADRLKRLAGHRDADRFGDWIGAGPAQLIERWSELHRTLVIPCVMRRVAQGEAAERLTRLLERVTPLDPIVVQQRQTILDILAAWRRGASLVAPRADLDELRESAKMKKREKAWPAPADYREFKEACEQLRKLIDRVADELAFDPEDARPAAQVGLWLLELAGTIANRYAQAKQAAAAVDIRDLLVRTRALLVDPDRAELRERVAGQIRLLLVDEFQDTDPVQVELIEALCGGGLETGKLFFVGDFKQSIYRFRGADPLVFRKLRQRLPERGRLPLSLNFRSQPAILRFVNALFADQLGPEYEPLVPHRAQITREPAIEFLWALPEGTVAGREPADQVRSREADWIARRLRALVDSAEPIVASRSSEPGASAGPRGVRYGDIAILFRALSDVSHYEEALRRVGLPYYLVGGHAFYAQQEIFDLVNLLRAVNDPSDVVSLAGALRSPFFCLADETLFWLAEHPGGLAAGFEAQALPSHVPDAERRAVEFAVATLRALRAAKDRVSIAELVQQALAATGYDALLVAEFLGERKLANLQKLIDLARDFERDGLFKLADFITELANQVSEQPKEALASTHGADMDVVRLMTVHQSKGLEFPVVVVADCDRVAQSRPASVEFHPDWGPLAQLPDSAEMDATAGYAMFKLLAAEEEEAEIRRLFYVATTRAADYLILSAGLTRLDALQGPWTRLLAKRCDLASGEFRPLPTALPTLDPPPRVAVIDKQPSCAAAAALDRRPPWRELVDDACRQAADMPSTTLRRVAPLAPALGERREFSFSRLTGAISPTRRRPAPAPDELHDEPNESIDPRGLGTLVHAVLADARFSAPAELSSAALAALVDRHAPRHVDPQGPEGRLALELVERFARSSRAAQLATAREDLVEVEFLLAWPDATADGVYLRGFIDRLYRTTDGQWTLLDFKTNRVRPGELARVASEYELQMLVYAAAAEKALGQPPRSLALHMLRSGEEFKFAWNDAARSRLAKLLDGAIAAWRART